MIMTRIAPAALAIGMLLAAPSPQPASANGAAFFADPNRIAEDGTLYFGIVKDQKGNPVVGASVQIHVKGQNIEWVYQTTSLGRYRSIDLPKDTDPKLVEVVVEKSGLRIVSQDNRTRTVRPGLPVEINFVVGSATTG